ncbi:MAG: type secretion system protein [Oscillospiraceae bacterium]|jgi:tight adherence protein B|nr:type secretion system protein [Oscillospiraceae bacterium]
MLELLLSVVAGFFIYALVTIILSANDKVIVKGRFSKYLNTSTIDEVQYQVLKEKQEDAKKKKLLKYRLANKEFSNYLAMSGVKLSAGEYIGLWVLSTFMPMLLVLLFKGSIVTIIGIGIIGFALPPFFVGRAGKKRQEAFDKQLGESLIIMGNCIKAGFSFQQAMESIAKEMQPPISTEFSKALREVHYGVSLEDALRHMVERVKNKDLDLLASAVLTSAQVGGNLSEILAVISETVKDRIKIKNEVRILTSSGRTSGLIIGLLPVFIILVLMLINPEYFNSFFDSQLGKFMMVLSVVLEATGFAIINKIVNIKY